MTATVLRTPSAAGPRLYAGTADLLRFALRRDRRRLLVWVLSLGLITVYAAVALGKLYPTVAARQSRAAVIASPAGVLLSGPGYGLDHYTLGAMIANELALSVMVAAAIMSIQLVVRQTRAEEESGRAELVRAAVVGRRAPLTAALLETALADVVLIAVITAGLAGSGLAPIDSLVVAVGIGLTGLLFGAVAAITAQLSAHARAASGAALAVLAVAVVVRGVGDILHIHGSPLSWISPIAWAQQTRAFADLRWWPLLLSGVAVVVLGGLAYRLVALRDVGEGLVAPRRGRATAGGSLTGLGGLALRLQRASLIGWGTALLVAGAVFGSLAEQVAGMVAGNPQLAKAVGAAANHDVTKGFFAVTAQYLAVAVGAFAVASVLRAQGEEAAGRTEVLLASPADRRRYVGDWLGVAAAASAGLLLVAGLGTGLAAAAAMRDGGLVAAQVGAQLVGLPAVLVLAALAAALYGAVPRLVSLAWLPVTWAVVVTSFGPLLDLPRWAQRLSPFGWLTRVPDEPVGWGAVAGLTAVAVALVVVGAIGFRRRDVPA